MSQHSRVRLGLAERRLLLLKYLLFGDAVWMVVLLKMMVSVLVLDNMLDMLNMLRVVDASGCNAGNPRSIGSCGG